MATRNVLEEKIRLYVETAGDKELGALAANLSKLAEGSDTAADQAQSLVEELQKLAATSNNIRNFTLLKASIADTGEALQRAKERMAGLASEVDRTTQPTRKLQRELERSAAEVEKLTKQQNRQQAELQRTSGALSRAGVDTAKLGDAYANLQQEFGGVTRRAGAAADAMQRTAKDGKAAATGVSALDRAASASSKSLALIAGKLTIVSGAATAAIQGLAAVSGAALFTGALRSAATLEDALSQVQAVSGATADEMERLKAAAEEGGARTRFSSLEAAQGLGELARATGSAQAAIAALPATLNLAQAAGIGVAEAAQFITTTLTQYGLAADQASRVSDVLARAANSTTADVQGLGNALSYAAPLAKQLGLDTEQTVAIIGALADQGFRGERAGTALRNVFTELQDPASRFSKAVRELGIDTRDFATVIEQLGTKGRRGQEALLELDAAARPAILALVNSGSTALRQLETDLRNASGSAEETARTMGSNLSGAAESIRDSFDRTRRSLIEPLLEPLRDDLFALATELEQFAQSPEFEEIKVALRDMFVEGTNAARELLQEVDFAELAQNIKASLGDAGTTITEFKENIGTVVDTVVILGNTFSLVFNGIQAAVLLIAGAISKLAAAGAMFADAFVGPAARFAEFIGLVEEGAVDFGEIAGGLNAVADEFGNRFANNFDEAAAAAKRLAGAGEDAAKATTEAFTTLEPVTVRATVALQEQGAAGEAAAAGLAAAGDAAAATAASTGDAAARIEDDVERLKRAFADMGLTAQADLERAADSAKANFDLIREAAQSGEASAEDARRAYAKYAEAARAAVADSDASAKQRVESELSVQAAVLQVGDALDEVGTRAIASGEKIAQGAATGRSGFDSLARSTERAADGADQLAISSANAGANATMAGDAANNMSIELTGLSDNLVKAYVAMNRFAGTRFWSDNINRITADWREQNTQLEALNANLDEQLSKFDPLTERVEKLRAEYRYLTEEQLRATAARQQRLEEEQRRATEESRRLRDEARRVREDAAQAAADASGTGNQPIGSTAAQRGNGTLRDLGSITVTLPDGTSSQLVTDGDGAEVLGRMFDELSRSRAITTRRRR